MRTMHCPLIGVVLLLAACSQSGDGQGGQGAGLPVTVIVAAPQPIEETLPVLVRVEAPVQPLVLAETAGRVLAVHVDVGQAVEAGSLLVELDDRDQRLAVAAAEAQLSRLAALIRQERRTVERLRSLARRDSVSAAALEEAQAREEALLAQRREAEAALDGARLALERTRILSPIAGVVDQRLVGVGDYLAPGKPVASLVGGDERRLVAALPETIAPRLRAGMTLRLSAPEGVTLELAVESLRPAVSPAGRAIEVLAFARGDEARALRAGARIAGELVLERREGFWLPALAVVERRAGTTVYLASGGRAEARQVETGVRRGGFVEVRSGLEAGAQVIVEGAGFLTDGAPIRIQEQTS